MVFYKLDPIQSPVTWLSNMVQFVLKIFYKLDLTFLQTGFYKLVFYKLVAYTGQHL